MDNTNNNPLNPSPIIPVATPPTPPTWPAPTEPASTPTPEPAPVEPTSTPAQPYPTPAPWPDIIPAPIQPEPTSAPMPAPAPAPWPIPTESVSVPPQPAPEPTPAFGAPDQSAQYTDPNTFTTNDLSTPTSVPVQSTPAWVPPQSVPQANPMGIETSEQAPTDLSHLIGNSDTNNQTNTQPETLVIPQSPTPDIPTVPATHSGGMPKWIIGLGIGLLIIVAGASAYFILGVGKAPKNTSLPAQEVPAVTQPSAPTQPPIETSAPQSATESSNFGELQGSGSAPQATSEATPNSFDRLRSR